MVVSEIQLYELLKARIGEKEATAFVEILDKRVDKKFDDAKQLLSTKEDMVNVKADIIKWMFIFWVGQLAATVAIIKLLA